MAKYIVTSKDLKGEFRIDFDPETEELVCFENNAILTTAQLVYLYRHFPVRIDLLKRDWKKCQLTLIPDRPPTFEEFWQRYNYKKGKKNAEKEWQKLSPENHAKAYRKVAQYQNDCRSRHIPLLYAERYLKQARFNDE